jgi:ornithine--oxo-acid transaminase
MSQSEFIEQEKHFSALNYSPLEVVIHRAKGVWMWDLDGRRYLDLMSAYSAVSHGHCHPGLIKVLKKQASTLCVISRAFYSDKMLPLLQKLSEITGLPKGLLSNSGAEAVETAIKAARRWGYRYKNIPHDTAEIIVAENNFHGRTTSVISFSTEESYKQDFGPFTPGFKTVPFGDLKALEKAISSKTCAVLLEPIQGEAGIIVPPFSYLEGVRALCDKAGILLLLDEIQSGLGRSGKCFAFQHEDLMPDGLILGKALGGGILPVSCFMATEELMSVFNPGSHGSTFGGNPLACSIALEALKVLEKEGLIERSRVLGDYVLAALKKIQSPLIQEVRGRGLWLGIEIKEPYSARAICEELLAKGLLTKEAHEKVIRIAPPLVITTIELDWAIEQITQVFTDPKWQN